MYIHSDVCRQDNVTVLTCVRISVHERFAIRIYLPLQKKHEAGQVDDDPKRLLAVLVDGH